jgi:signal transduction histidine kinase
VADGDEQWMHQVIENLLDNAIKYSPRGRAVWLDVRPHGESVRLEVRDEGPGIGPEDLPRLFGRFQRLSARPTGGESATGLGLYIVKQLVELSGGSVAAASSGPGTGATVTLRWPVRNSQQ